MTRREWLQSAAALPVASALSGAAEESPSSKGILNLSRSPQARVRNIPVHAVRMDDGFWTPRRRVNLETSIPTMIELLESHGVVDNFRRLSKGRQVPIRGPIYTDSDLYKWMEAVAFALQSSDEARLKNWFDSYTDEIAAAQEPSGYLHTHLVGDRVRERFERMDTNHELYCLGHMLQAAIAYQRATGGSKLLDVGLRYVRYLERDFGPGKHPLLTGHPELEMALVELYRTTGERQHLELAGYLLHGDERLNLPPRRLVYMFSGKPFTSRKHLEGHAVRAMYACCGATDYYLETGDTDYRRALVRLWDDMTRHKMYLTGGVGSRSAGEAFGEPYELPNQIAYTESCAAIAAMMWNWRMLAATGDARYTDVLERELYNGVNSGMSLEGNLYCYRNPLELTGDPEDPIRNPWYDTTCCPPNLERVLASLPGYLYGSSAEGIYVHLYHSSRLEWRLEQDGTPVRLTQTTRYPWSGDVEIAVEPAMPHEFTVFLRIPGWSRAPRVEVNGDSDFGVGPGRYVPVRRRWAPGDRVRLVLDMRPRVTAANTRVTDDSGKVAVERGPLVYCLEGLDQPGIESLFDVMLPLEADPDAGFAEDFRPSLLGGVVALKHKGMVLARSGDRPLYEPFAASRANRRETDLTFIPYYTFANREATPMQVWVPAAWDQARR